MGQLAVLILTKNEIKNIATVIENARQCTSEVVIIDSGSTDGTVEKARELGAKVCYRQWDNDFAAQRNYGLTQTDAEWVLFLDADERMDEVFADAVKSLVQDNKPIQGAMVRRVVAFGHCFKYGAFAPDKAWRFFPRKAVTWKNKVHESPECSLEKRVLAGSVWHYTYDDWHQYFEKFDNYTKLAAEKYAKEGKRCNFVLDIVLRPLWAFFKIFFLNLGVLDGKAGFVFSVYHYFYTLTKYVRLSYLYKSKGKF